MEPSISILPPSRSGFAATIYIFMVLQCELMDATWFGCLSSQSKRAPCPLWTPRRPSFHPAVSFHTIKLWTHHSRGAKIWHLPHNDVPWRSKPARIKEVQGRVTQKRSKPGSHNGDPRRFAHKRSKPGSHNGDPRRFTQWRSQPGSYNVDPNLDHTMEIQSRVPQWRSKPVNTMEIQSRVAQCRLKAGSKMEIQANSFLLPTPIKKPCYSSKKQMRAVG